MVEYFTTNASERNWAVVETIELLLIVIIRSWKAIQPLIDVIDT